MKSLIWMAFVSLISGANFLFGSLYLKYSSDSDKLDVYYYYSISMYVGGLLALVIYNSIRFKFVDSGFQYKIKVPALIFLVLISFFSVEIFLLIFMVIRLGVIRNVNDLKFNIVRVVSFLLFVFMALSLVYFYMEDQNFFWRYYFSATLSLIFFILIAFLGECIWLPKNIISNKHLILEGVIDKNCLDLSMLFMPILCLTYAKFFLSHIDVQSYMMIIATLAGTGVIVAPIEAIIIKMGVDRIKLHSACLGYLFLPVFSFLLAYYYFGLDAYLCVLIQIISVLQFKYGLMMAELRSLGDVSHIKTSLYIALIPIASLLVFYMVGFEGLIYFLGCQILIFLVNIIFVIFAKRRFYFD